MTAVFAVAHCINKKGNQGWINSNTKRALPQIKPPPQNGDQVRRQLTSQSKNIQPTKNNKNIHSKNGPSTRGVGASRLANAPASHAAVTSQEGTALWQKATKKTMQKFLHARCKHPGQLHSLYRNGSFKENEEGKKKNVSPATNGHRPPANNAGMMTQRYLKTHPG